MKMRIKNMRIKHIHGLVGNLPGVVLWLAVLPLAAFGQANYAAPYTFTTLAGNTGCGSADGTNSAARFAQPYGTAVDTNGNLYVGDGANNTIRKGFPANSVSPPILQPPSLSAGQFGFGVTGIPCLAVTIESSGDLYQWQVIGTCTLEGGTNCFVSPNPSQGAQFYRIQVR